MVPVNGFYVSLKLELERQKFFKTTVVIDDPSLII